MFLWIVPCLTLIGLAALLVRWAQEDRSRRLAVGLAFAAWGVATLALLRTTPVDVPFAYLTSLHEGTGRTTFARAFGFEIHAGPMFDALIHAFGIVSFGDLRAVVRMNLWMWAMSNIATALVASSIFERRTTVVFWTVIAALNPAAVHGAWSETPAPLLSWATWAGVLPLVILDPRRGRRDGWNVAAVLTMAGLTATATLVRVEAVIVAGPALATMIARLMWGDAALDAATARVTGELVARLRQWSARPLFPWIVLAVGLIAHFSRWVGEYTLGTTLWVANVIGPESLGPLTHALAYLPAGVMVLAVPGAVALGRSSWRTGFVVLTLPALLRGYASSSNGVFLELFRYMAMGSPLLILVSLFGWRELQRWAAATADPALWRGVMLVALPMLFIVPPPAGLQRFISLDRRDTPDFDKTPFLLSTLQQEEVRLAVEARDRWPTCTLITRVTPESAGAFRGENWEWMIIEKGMPSPRTLPTKGGDLAQVITREVQGPCVVFVAGQDCNLTTTTDHCDVERAQGTPLIERVVMDGQFNNPPEFGRVLGEALIGAYAIGAVPASR